MTRLLLLYAAYSVIQKGRQGFTSSWYRNCSHSVPSNVRLLQSLYAYAAQPVMNH